MMQMLTWQGVIWISWMCRKMSMSVLLPTYTPAHAGWITQQKKQAFLYGCPHTDHQAKAQAYQALRTPTEVQPFLGLDTDMGPCQIADVRSQPADRDAGYQAAERRGQGPDTAAAVATLLLHKELIESCGMVYVIVDNRAAEEVEHWPAFAQWWEARRTLVGPQQERTDILWAQATHANGLRAVPYYWAGVFVLEAARFLFPKVHFGLVDNDCVPVITRPCSCLGVVWHLYALSILADAK